MDIYFISSNKYKIKEVTKFFKDSSINIIPYKEGIKELQSKDINEIVVDKAIKAFKKIRRPLFVEHTGLYIKELGGFPGGLTQVFWDSILADKFCYYFKNTNVIAKTRIAYCDGNTVKIFKGKIKGKIAESPQGNKDFQWDCVFIPNGYDKTFSQMGKTKNKISMRRKALEKLKKHLEANNDE